MNTRASDVLTYVNLQMAAESTQIPDGHHGAIDPKWLSDGNNRSSKTPNDIIRELTTTWEIAAHLANTPTGLSATLFKNGDQEYVLSLRSTEFVDDAVRDNKATNELEVKATGFALGQLSDLDDWVKSLQKAGKLPAGTSVTVSEYPISALATANFRKVRAGRSAVSQTAISFQAAVGVIFLSRRTTACQKARIRERPKWPSSATTARSASAPIQAPLRRSPC